MSKYQEEITRNGIKTGAEEPESAWSLSDFEGFDFEVQTRRGINCHLCGYDLGFGFAIVNGKKIPKRYRLQAKNFPSKAAPEQGVKLPESVLPEIMLKLVDNEVVDVVNKTAKTAAPKK